MLQGETHSLQSSDDADCSQRQPLNCVDAEPCTSYYVEKQLSDAHAVFFHILSAHLFLPGMTLQLSGEQIAKLHVPGGMASNKEAPMPEKNNPPACYYQSQLAVYRVERSRYAAINLENVTHPYWIVSHVLQGNVTTTCQGLTFAANSGDVMIHAPHIPFTERAHRPGIHEWIMIDAWTQNHIDVFHLYPVYPVVALTDPCRFTAMFSSMLAAWHSTQQPFRNERLAASAQQLIAELLMDWHAHGAVTRPEALFTQPWDRFPTAIRFMRDHLHEQIHLADLAKIVHLHPNYFHRVFSRTYGMSPAEMLQHIRLERARALLDGTMDPIKQVAQACGVRDPAYFARWFQRALGVSPRAYRQQRQTVEESYPTGSSLTP